MAFYEMLFGIQENENVKTYKKEKQTLEHNQTVGVWKIIPRRGSYSEASEARTTHFKTNNKNIQANGSLSPHLAPRSPNHAECRRIKYD